MSFAPTPAQALLLFGVLARHGACAQAELMPAVKRADREALVKARFVSAGKAGRGIHLTLEDAGWAWSAENLGAELPPAQRALSGMLCRLGEYFARSGATLQDVIGAKPEVEAPRTTSAKPKARPPNKPRTKATRKAPTPAALRKRIETAYLTITSQRKNQSVKLSKLRAELADLDRATVDSALRRILAGDKTASLMRHDDPRQLDRTDHEAAFNPAGEPFHVLWIAS